MGKRILVDKLIIDGNGNGYGDGYGYGYGNGNGYGDGYGYGNGDGNGDGYGYGNGYGDGNGDGYGNGYGYGDGNGYGYGDGYGDGLIFISHDTPIIAWHIANDDSYLSRPIFDKRIKAEVGLVLEWPYYPKMCDSGFHASIKKEDAAKYQTPGLFCKVACSGWCSFQQDKLVCTRREILEIEKKGGD